MFIRLKLKNFRNLYFYHLHNNFLNLTINRFLNVNATARRITARHDLVNNHRINNATLNNHTFINRHHLNFTNLLSLVIPERLRTLTNNNLKTRRLSVRVIRSFFSRRLNLKTQSRRTENTHSISRTGLHTANSMLRQLTLHTASSHHIRNLRLHYIRHLIRTRVRISAHRTHYHTRRPLNEGAKVLLTTLNRMLLNPLRAALSNPSLIYRKILPSWTPNNTQVSRRVMHRNNAQRKAVKDSCQRSTRGFT